MRALTVRQPWAHAIVHGGKDVENRKWPTKHRGLVVIHAAGQLATAEAWCNPLIKRMRRENDPTFETAAIIGVADLVGCHPDGMHECLPDVSKALICSDWAMESHWHWLLANARPLAAPIPAKGRLGLWTLPDDVAAAVLEQVTL